MQRWSSIVCNRPTCITRIVGRLIEVFGAQLPLRDPVGTPSICTDVIIGSHLWFSAFCSK